MITSSSVALVAAAAACSPVGAKHDTTEKYTGESSGPEGQFPFAGELDAIATRRAIHKVFTVGSSILIAPNLSL